MNLLNIKEIAEKINDLGATHQPTLFHVERQVERDGIEMGVLENELPYLSERGLANYPQAKSNPQPAWAYPELALGLFRQWLRTNYIETKLPKSLSDKAKAGILPANKVPAVLMTLQGTKVLS